MDKVQLLTRNYSLITTLATEDSSVGQHYISKMQHCLVQMQYSDLPKKKKNKGSVLMRIVV